MKNLLQKLLGIKTLKFILVHPGIFELMSPNDIAQYTKGMPVFWIATHVVADMKVVDTGIPVPRIKLIRGAL